MVCVQLSVLEFFAPVAHNCCCTHGLLLVTGWPHCERHHFFDQHALVLGRALVHNIVQRYHTLKCSRYGGISLRHWQLAGPESRNKTTSYGNVGMFYHRRAPVATSSAVCQQHITVHYVQTEAYWQVLRNNARSNSALTTQSLGLRNARPCANAASNAALGHFESFINHSRSHTSQLRLCDAAREETAETEIPYNGGL